MKITKIKRLVSFGNMENISMECEIKEGESISEAAQYLESEIKKQIFKIENLKRSKQAAYHENSNIEGESDELPPW